jgi:hypothetical protein
MGGTSLTARVDAGEEVVRPYPTRRLKVAATRVVRRVGEGDCHCCCMLGGERCKRLPHATLLGVADKNT